MTQPEYYVAIYFAIAPVAMLIAAVICRLLCGPEDPKESSVSSHAEILLALALVWPCYFLLAASFVLYWATSKILQFGHKQKS